MDAHLLFPSANINPTSSNHNEYGKLALRNLSGRSQGGVIEFKFRFLTNPKEFQHLKLIAIPLVLIKARLGLLLRSAQGFEAIVCLGSRALDKLPLKLQMNNKV